MELNIHPILPEERISMGGHSNRELNAKTGCIGYLTANLNAGIPEFESSWRDQTKKLNTPEFTDDFNDMIDTLRQGVLKSPNELRTYCAAHPDSALPDNSSSDRLYGFRIDTGRYSHMLVCSFHSTDSRLWLNAFSFLALDRYMREARNGIPILDRQGYEQFRMPDGGKLRVTSPDGFSSFYTVRYFDQNRLVLFDEFHEGTIHSIRELPEWAAVNKYQLVPVNQSIRDSCRPRRKGQER
ncbi:MAG: hypothetical protein ACLR94_01185 [Acutalibacteraceae bacterium]